MISEERKARLAKQGYRLVGNHTAVKVCHWCKSSIRGDSACYKNTFYGIQSWRCIQMAPTLDSCNFRCEWCWRDIKYIDKGLDVPVIDSPKEIVDGCIDVHKELLMGFKGFEGTDFNKFWESMRPIHVAISLTGEPTLYPFLPELIKEFHSRKMTTYLVSNASRPAMIQRLLDEEQPTQMYMTLPAPNAEIFKRAVHPLYPEDNWETLMESFSKLHKFDRSVARLTVTKGVNMVEPEEYARLLTEIKPAFVEIKGYVNVGFSKKRLSLQAMPSNAELKEFSEKINKILGYEFASFRAESNVALLWNGITPRFIDFKKWGIDLPEPVIVPPRKVPGIYSGQKETIAEPLPSEGEGCCSTEELNPKDLLQIKL